MIIQNFRATLFLKCAVKMALRPPQPQNGICMVLNGSGWYWMALSTEDPGNPDAWWQHATSRVSHLSTAFGVSLANSHKFVGVSLANLGFGEMRENR